MYSNAIWAVFIVVKLSPRRATIAVANIYGNFRFLPRTNVNEEYFHCLIYRQKNILDDMKNILLY